MTRKQNAIRSTITTLLGRKKSNRRKIRKSNLASVETLEKRELMTATAVEFSVHDFDEGLRMTGDVNGDGKADIVSFSDAGVTVSTAGDASHFAPAENWTSSYGRNWDEAKHSRMLADVNDDGKDDVVGIHDKGVYVSISTGRGFHKPRLWTKSFGNSRGWTPAKHPRMTADVNGDGRADIVGFGDSGVYVSLSTGKSFTKPKRWTTSFDYSSKWRTDKHPRMMADVNGDGKDDIVGFGNSGVSVGLSNGRAFGRGPSLKRFGYNSAYRVNKHPRMTADVNGDGRADIVGFGNKGVGVAISTKKGFVLGKSLNQFGYNSGWRV